MISFNPFNILHVNVTIIYILWISVFFILSARIRWPGSSGWPDGAGPHADGEPASYGQRLFGIGLEIGDDSPGQYYEDNLSTRS